MKDVFSVMKKYIKFAALTAGALFLAKGLDNRIDLSFFDIESEKIPQDFNGFKIVHLSDYHNDPVPGLVEEVRNISPDIIVMTGDMTDDKDKGFTPAVELVKHLQKIAQCYIVSGNHDLWRPDFDEFVKICRDLGVRFLQNQTEYIKRNDSKIVISGMEDVFTKTRMTKTVEKYLKYFSKTEEYQIFLFHRANALDSVKDFGFDLILAGHLHGGHVRIPGIGGLCSPLSSVSESKKFFFPKYFGGLYTHNDCKMIVNRGLGNPTPVPRFFNRPEIGIITLHHKEK